jgi:UDP-N-acetylmuramate dehydrogenase
MTFDIEAVYKELHPHFQGRVRRNESLARHCTFGVGGPADVWISVDRSQDLIELVRLCAERSWPLLLVGNGTNILYADAGVRGIVTRIALDHYSIQDHGDSTALMIAEAGTSWPRLLNELAALGWGGLEFGPGIPGTLGGGVISNAGAHNTELSEVLAWVEVIDARGSSLHQTGITVPMVRRYTHDEIDLGYRQSRFRAGRHIAFDAQGYPIVPPRWLIEPAEIIVQLGVRLHRENPEQLKAIIEDHKQHRKRTQPSQKSAGSVFKNPPGDFAGRLIDQAGMKGTTHGKAQISQRHANFIVNLGGASAADVVALIVEARKRVRDQFGVELELEVELRGEWRAGTHDESKA